VSSVSPYKIPIVDLRAQYSKIREEVRQAIDEVADSQQFILGPAVKDFEEQVARYLQCNFAVGVASGSDALLLALMALAIGRGDGVIVTPFTFFSTVSSITRLGATPLFVDIDADSYLLSAEGVEQFLDRRGQNHDGLIVDSQTGLRIKALLPVHLFGQCCAMDDFLALTNKYPLQIIEDVAQACGARMRIGGKTQFAGTIGDVGCFSFFPSKTLGGFGDGGLLAVNEKTLADRLNALRMHGESRKYYHDVTGINSRLDSLQAAVLAVKQKYLEAWCEERIQRADTYRRLFEQTALVGNQLIGIPAPSTDKSHVFNNYVVRAERRDELKQFLGEHGIQSEIYYPRPLHLQICFADLGYKRGEFPRAELVAQQVLALPLYPELTLKQQEMVVEQFEAFYRR
jgi:dTDP-4-amino-4,6-dideoxygalactose transaminase